MNFRERLRMFVDALYVLACVRPIDYDVSEYETSSREKRKFVPVLKTIDEVAEMETTESSEEVQTRAKNSAEK